MLDEKANFRKEFFAATDSVSPELKHHFDQPGMDMLVKLESVLIDSASGWRFTVEELIDALGIHNSDVDLNNLMIQLALLIKVFSSRNVTSLEGVMAALKTECQTVIIF